MLVLSFFVIIGILYLKKKNHLLYLSPASVIRNYHKYFFFIYIITIIVITFVLHYFALQIDINVDPAEKITIEPKELITVAPLPQTQDTSNIVWWDMLKENGIYLALGISAILLFYGFTNYLLQNNQETIFDVALRYLDIIDLYYKIMAVIDELSTILPELLDDNAVVDIDALKHVYELFLILSKTPDSFIKNIISPDFLQKYQDFLISIAEYYKDPQIVEYCRLIVEILEKLLS